MYRLILLALALPLMTGCAITFVPPGPDVQVATLPTDCHNKDAIARYHQQTAAHPKSILQSREEYNARVSFHKAQMWTIRYNCQRVR